MWRKARTQCDPGAGDGGAAGAAVGVQHVAVERDADLAHQGAIHHGAKGAANQALDFLGTAGLLAASRLTVAARMSGPWQHAVLGGDPPQAGIAQERRHAAFDTGGAEHLRVAHADQARAFGMAGEAGCERDGTQFSLGAAGWAHEAGS